MITNVDDFFSQGCGRCERFATADCSTRKWLRGLMELRRICRAVGLTEAAKWGHPCYLHGERNIAILGALRGDFRLSFFNAALMKDPKSVLEKTGPNTPFPDTLRFTENIQPTVMEPIISAYLRESIGYAEAGIKPPKIDHPIELPPELLEALECDPELAAAFYKLTPGRQKSYAINLNSAKKSETRIARIAKFREHILAGKGALER